jgi:lactobin A/cerein 7B family class IIb bacteriocin
MNSVSIPFNNFDLSTLNCVELTQEETIQAEGGFLPVIAIYACWGVMAAASVVAVGMAGALHDYQATH